MKNPLSFLRESIRARLLLVLLGITTVSLLIVAILSVDSIIQTGQEAEEAARRTLRSQAEEFLVNLVVAAAETNDLRLESVRRDAAYAADYATAILENPELFAGSEYWRASDYVFVGSDGQLMNDEEDVSSVFVPNFIEITDEVIAELEQYAPLDFVFGPIYEADPNTVFIYIIGTSGAVRAYPNIGLGTILPPDIDFSEEIFFAPATPDNNPDREVVWSPVYDDPAEQGFLVTAVAPVYAFEDDFLAIIGIDLSLAELTTGIEADSPVAGGYFFLVNADGQALALPEQGYEDVLGRTREEGEFGPDLTRLSNEFDPILTNMVMQNTGFQTVNVGGRELFVAYAPLESTGWGLAYVADSGNLLQVVADLQTELDNSTQALISGRILPAGILILVVTILVGLWFTGRLATPLQRLATAAQQIGAGNLDQELPPAGDDEVGQLSAAFGQMAGQLQDTLASMEQLVAERTAELETALNELEAAMEMTAPVIQVWDGVLLLPLVGTLDGERARDVMATALARIEETEALTLIIDISGIPVVDKEVASHLITITRATRLMGCESIISGISPVIAETITELAIDISSIETATTLQNALSSALARAGA